MFKAKSLAALVGAALLSAALPGSAMAQDAATTPEGEEWILIEYTSDGSLTAVPSGVEPTLLLEEGQATGSGGCNSFFGTYALDGALISFGQEFGRTQMFCEGDPQVVEDAYLSTLPTVTSWALEDGALRLRGDDETDLLVFGAADAGMPDTDIDAVLAALETLTLRLGGLEDRIVALETGVSEAKPVKPKKPRAPAKRGKVKTEFPDWMRDELRPEAERSDEKNREVADWRDRSKSETGVRVYARRGYCELKPDADPSEELTDKDFRKGRGDAVLIDELPADTTSYQPDHAAIDAALPEAPESEYSADQFYDLRVSAFNDVGESKPVRVASYFLTPEFNCP